MSDAESPLTPRRAPAGGRSWRRAIVTLLSISVVGAVLTGVPAGTSDAAEIRGNVERISGRDRFETAAATASRFRDNGGSLATVVLVSGRSFADALSAAGLAGLLRATVLFTERDTLPDPTRQRLVDGWTRHVVIVGGTAAVNADVEAELTELDITVERIAGADRYATAAAVARRIGKDGIGGWLGRRTALVVSGVEWADALAVGPAAWAGPHPIVLTGARYPAAEVAELLAELDVSHAVVVARQGALSFGVARVLRDAGLDVRWLSRTTAAETSGRVARELALTHPEFPGEIAATVSGADFVDGLAAAPLLGLLGATLVLDDALPGGRGIAPQGRYFATWLESQLRVQHALIIGGYTAVPTSTLREARALLREKRSDDFVPERSFGFVFVEPPVTTQPGTTRPRTTQPDDPVTTLPEPVYVTPTQVAGDTPNVTKSAFHDGSGKTAHEYWGAADFPKVSGLDLTPIRRACSGKDCFVSDDVPTFQTASTYDLWDSANVLAMTVGSETRAYPVSAVSSHEVINDTFGDVPVAVTY